MPQSTDRTPSTRPQFVNRPVPGRFIGRATRGAPDILYGGRAIVAAIAACIFASCGAPATLVTGSRSLPPLQRQQGSAAITHVIVVIQENRSFDNLFATFPGVDGATRGEMKLPSGGDVWVELHAVPLSYPCDFGHGYKAFIEEYDGGSMDGFGFVGGGQKCPGKAGTAPYQYVDPRQIAPYWDMAKYYVLADQMFQTQGSGSFTAHQDLIAGGTTINPHKTRTLVDFPTHKPWGCDAPPNTETSVLVDVGSNIVRRYGKGPFPCLTYPTIRDLLDGAGISWKYYSPPEPRGAGSVWNAFDAIKAVRNGSEWHTNIALTTSFFSDVSNGTLPSVAWIVPDRVNSDHPGSGSDFGPSWVASIVNAMGESAYWSSTAIVVVWDDWGGMYDHRAPPFLDRWGGLGFRVPMLVVSPYSRQGSSKDRGYVSHTQYEFASILKFIEDLWGLGRLGTTDVRAASIADCFNFKQPPRAFHPILAPYSRRYFVHQPFSYKPVDDE